MRSLTAPSVSAVIAWNNEPLERVEERVLARANNDGDPFFSAAEAEFGRWVELEIGSRDHFSSWSGSVSNFCPKLYILRRNEANKKYHNKGTEPIGYWKLFGQRYPWSAAKCNKRYCLIFIANYIQRPGCAIKLKLPSDFRWLAGATHNGPFWKVQSYWPADAGARNLLSQLYVYLWPFELAVAAVITETGA